MEVCAQNVCDKPSGAFTGETAVSQLVDLNIKWTLAGHSERRTLFHESDAAVAAKVRAAVEGGVKVVICCGETLQEREADQTIQVVTRQLRAVLDAGIKDWSTSTVIAYEPVWAIGTGKVATTEQAQEVHQAIRAWLKKEVGNEAGAETRIIYGGSVTDKNCVELAKQADVDGFLVGGASLKPACEWSRPAIRLTSSDRHHQRTAVSSYIRSYQQAGKDI